MGSGENAVFIFLLLATMQQSFENASLPIQDNNVKPWNIDIRKMWGLFQLWLFYFLLFADFFQLVKWAGKQVGLW